LWKLAFYNPAWTVWYDVIRWQEGVFCICLYLLVVKFKAHPVLYIALGAVAGIVMKF
jgi:hypothetical protein